MLSLHQLCKTFAQKTVAQHIDLQIAKGEILAILGPSGCGKSTLLNMIAGLISPDSGTIYLDGVNINGVPPEKRHMALMFQDYALLPHLNVWQNVAFGLRMRGIAPSIARQQAQAILCDLGLTAESERFINRLSGGEQQRVALARALVVQPRVLLLDEPFSSLDTRLRHTLRDLTMQRVQQQHIPTLLVTHDPEEALLMANHIALMQDGHITQQGKPHELLQQPQSAWAARLLGCVNVHDDYYVPPAALVLDKHQGIVCPVHHVHYLSDGCRVLLQHPQFGELTFTLTAHDWAQYASHQQLPIWLDHQQIIWFH